MNELEKYLIAREQIREFYEDVVWVKLEKKIDELCEKIRDYDETVYENLTKNRHAIPYLKKAATTLFTENIKVNTEADKKKIPKNLGELADQEMGLIEQIPEVFKKILKQVYNSFLSDADIDESRLDAEGFHPIHRLFQEVNTKIRYPNGSPYIGTQKHKASWEFFEFNTGVVYNLMSNRDHHAHSADFMAPRYFKKAGRKVYDPLTDIEIPSNYIMLANLSIGCVYEIIELMQIWIDSQKIGKKNSSK